MAARPKSSKVMKAEAGDDAAVHLEMTVGEGFAGAHVDGPEADVALTGEDFLDDVEVASRDAGGGDEHVGVGQRLMDAGGEGFDGVAGDLEDARDAAAV